MQNRKLGTAYLNLIRDNLIEMHRKNEIVEIKIPEEQAEAANGETDRRSYGYGAFKDDPGWGELFDEIERNRDGVPNIQFCKSTNC
ncbi:hypothetical protein QUF80_18920 [Desulfococcaceae bacterium HSG8]|nr:hypothetical protein [Desulfococcaceae bacterium HSG8]